MRFGDSFWLICGIISGGVCVDRGAVFRGKGTCEKKMRTCFGFLKKNTVMVIALVAAAVLLMESSFRRDKKKSDDELEKIKEEIRRLKEEQQ